MTRARYVTICQQFLVTAVVVAVGLSAAGVMTLKIVTPGSPGASGPTASDLLPAVTTGDSYVDQAPVMPKVREVAVAPVAAAARRTVSLSTSDPATRKAAAHKLLAAESAPTQVHGYGTVGVTWKAGTKLAESQIAVQVRTKKNGTWSGWTNAAYHDEHGPDPGSAEAGKVRPGTDAVVVGNVDQVQMRAETSTGAAPSDLKLAVVDPGTGKMTQAAPAIDTAALPASDANATSSPPIESTAGSGADQAQSVGGDPGQDTATLAAMRTAPKPLIYSRAQWGANESLRDPSSLHYGVIQTGFIHHTVNANNYTADQVPALIRGIYAYHTQSRGWSDIGYNFLIDRFGRIWEGRYGGVDRAVVGAHTLGYNEYGFGVSAIGNYDIAQPTQAILDAEARLFAWKLSLSNIRASAGHLWVKDRYLYAINGHRDVGQTACPGRYLYAKIPSIRIAAQRIQDAAQNPAMLPIVPAPTTSVRPTATPRAAAAQPVITFPLRRNLAGSPYSDLVTKSASGAIAMVTTEGILGYGTPVGNVGPWRYMTNIVAVGDVTGDGHGDVLARSAHTGYARVYPGDGRGHVSASGVGGTTAFRGDDMIVAAGDMDHDGHPDVIARDRKTTALLLYRGLGHGTFAAPVMLRRAWPFVLTTMADVNRDGHPDVFAVRSDGLLEYLRGKGGITRTTVFDTAQVITRLPSVPSAITAGDISGDALPDLVVRWSNNLTTVYAGTRRPVLGQAYGSFTDLAGLRLISGSQMMGGAGQDVVGLDPTGRLLVVPSNGLRNLGSVLPTNLSVPGASQVLAVGDWNRDGFADVITREKNGTNVGGLLVLRPGLGNGKFGQGRSLGTGWFNVRSLSAVGDVTGDGYPDLMGRIGTGPLLIFPGNGNSGFKTPVLAPDSLRTFDQIGSAAWSPRGAAFVSADGSFVPLTGSDLGTALRAANGQSAAIYDTYVGAGDVDGDGIPDVLAREKGTGTLWLLPGKTSGGLAPRVWVANGFAGYQLIG